MGAPFFLVATIAIELLVALIVFRGVDRRHLALTVVSVNLITHPLAWLAVSSGISWLTVEGAVMTVEVGVFALLFPRHRHQAILCAVLMNIASAAVGMIV